MKKLLVILCCFVAVSSFAQESLPELLKKYNTKNIPYTSVQELAMPKTKAIILDAREKEEYQTSHLKNAVYVGYTNFSVDSVIKKLPNKNKTIVVYCSIGIRSETIGFKLKKAGYAHVFNLYGGIFEWKNNHFPVFDSTNTETDKVHVFSKEWSKWLKSGIKVY
ncbi:rhodanese-like domain-containing protein [Yeosuana marina]|uniref:rhodanese-like domain-containing protein n=1 Tax=Yeosuana marina TaxID=1565536 RepID=UPI001423B5C4|nr:rhodanese-like domain-containing protein [Yeosuana marina]|tara:strand:- start:336 stop:827 length:492 start_codon:yes stop_codon:yes gene_type:complete